MFSILSLFTEDVKLRHDPMNNPNNPNNPYGTGPSRQGKEPFESGIPSDSTFQGDQT